jgi:SOS-response transcriptional repressor LexA
MVNAMDATIDPVRQLVRLALSERRLKMSDVSKSLGKNHAYLHQFLDRGIPARLPEGVREQLAMILQVPEAQLKGEGVLKGGVTAAFKAAALSPVSRTPGDKMPVFALGTKEVDGWFSWSGEIADYVLRPPTLAGATNAYAVYVAGSSMEPRYYVGELVHIHPGKPVTIGSFVLAQIRSGGEGEPPRASIRRLAKRTATILRLEQLNPPKEIDVKVTDLLSLHRIVGSAESSGV